MASSDYTSSRLGLAAAISLGSAVAAVQPAAAQTPVDWPTLGFALVSTNSFGQPTAIAHAGDGSQRLFVVQKPGIISVLENSNLLADPFLSITDRVASTGLEQGLLGIAFPSDFASKGHFFVDYTISNNSVVISRFQVSATNMNVADPNSEQLVLVIPKPYNNHNGGQLAFGPDGYLYIGIGDGGSEGDPQNFGQNPSVLLAKILRIDVESGVSPYAVPPNNPFVATPGYAPETWAWGLRNPWRFSFDRLTGDLYIGDVGQNRFEEVDFQPAGSGGGQNYGWRLMEGPAQYSVPAGFTNFSSLTPPVAWYSHIGLPSDISAAVTGGYVYRGPAEPRMDGLYFYGDEVVGWIWALKQQGTNWANFLLWSPLPPTNFAISTFGEDDEGRLYLADYARGRIYQLFDTRQTWTPVFWPTNGVINSNSVLITCASTNAEIHFTTNGLTPTTSDPLLPPSGLLPVATGLTNKARAFRADLSPSGVATAIFTLRVGTPVFTPAAGAITNETPVTLSTVTPGATIYFTTNGLNPTTNSLVYTAPIVISGPLTLRALGAAIGYSNSPIASASYTALPAATPQFSPPAGLFTNATSVSISCATPGALIRYTLDGTNPTTNSPTYSSPVLISQPTTLKAAAYRNDLGPSAIQSAFYGFLYFDRTVVTTLAGASTGGYSNAPATLALFSTPQAICFNSSGHLLVGDRGNHVIREILPGAVVQTFAGSGVSGYQDGPASEAQFEDTAGVCCDSLGTVFVSEGGCGAWRVRKVDTNALVSTVASVSGVCYAIGQVEVDGGDNVYAGYGGNLNKVTPTGQVTAIGAYGPYYGFVGVGIDTMTNIYALQGGQVWKVASDGTQTLFAGAPSTSGFSDGPALLALFQALGDAAVDPEGNVYVSDGNRVRKISSDGMVTTVAGTGVAGYVNGLGSVACFNNATGLCLDTNGNIFLTDTGNNCIRKISPDTAGIGIADDWQLAHFGYIGIDPNADPDHDGMSNYAEFWAGTDPLDARSVLRAEVAPIGSGHVQIRWQTVLGKTYLVQYSADLIAWSALGAPVQGDGSVFTVTDDVPVAPASRFYRLALTAF